MYAGDQRHTKAERNQKRGTDMAGKRETDVTIEDCALYYRQTYPSKYLEILRWRSFSGPELSMPPDYIDLPIGNVHYPTTIKSPVYGATTTEDRAQQNGIRYFTENIFCPVVLHSVVKKPDLFLFLSFLYCESLLGQIFHSEFGLGRCHAPDGRRIRQVNWGTVINPDPIAVFHLHDLALIKRSEEFFETGTALSVFKMAVETVLNEFISTRSILEAKNEKEIERFGREVRRFVNDHHELLLEVDRINWSLFVLEGEPIDIPHEVETGRQMLADLKNHLEMISSKLDCRYTGEPVGFLKLSEEQIQIVQEAFHVHCQGVEAYLETLPTKSCQE